MRLYLTWYAEPEDPHYWKFFEVDGIVASIKSITIMSRWKFNRILTVGFKKFFDYRGFLLVDSLLRPIHAEGTPLERPQAHVLYLQYLLGADLLVHKDTPLLDVRKNREKVLRKNWVNAEAAMKISEKLGRDVMLVVHGWDLESYAKSAEYFKKLGVKYIGIGSLLAFKNDEKFLVDVVKTVREVVGRRVYIHLFGINPARLGEYVCFVNSGDTSSPALAASKREAIVFDGEFRRVKITTLGGLSYLRSRVEESKDSTEVSLLQQVLNSKHFGERNRLLALYNAYNTLRYVNAVGQRCRNKI